MNNDFDSFNEFPIRESEIWLPSIPLRSGLYTDTGYRFVKNIFEKQDQWIPFFPNTKIEFYDLNLFNHDTFEVKEEINEIAKLYFRIDNV